MTPETIQLVCALLVPLLCLICISPIIYHWICTTRELHKLRKELSYEKYRKALLELTDLLYWALKCSLYAIPNPNILNQESTDVIKYTRFRGEFEAIFVEINLLSEKWEREKTTRVEAIQDAKDTLENIEETLSQYTEGSNKVLTNPHIMEQYEGMKKTVISCFHSAKVKIKQIERRS